MLTVPESGVGRDRGVRVAPDHPGVPDHEPGTSRFDAGGLAEVGKRSFGDVDRSDPVASQEPAAGQLGLAVRGVDRAPDRLQCVEGTVEQGDVVTVERQPVDGA